MPGSTKVLLVMARESQGPLLEQLQACGLEVLAACDCKEATELLQHQADVDVVLSGLSLGDGSWWSIRQGLARANTAAPLIVCLPRPDAGVSDILESGCSGVLIPPYDQERIRRSVQVAVARSRPPPPKPKEYNDR